MRRRCDTMHRRRVTTINLMTGGRDKGRRNHGGANMPVTKRKSRILEEMHKTARGLHTTGLIDKRRMREFDAL